MRAGLIFLFLFFFNLVTKISAIITERFKPSALAGVFFILSSRIFFIQRIKISKIIYWFAIHSTYVDIDITMDALTQLSEPELMPQRKWWNPAEEYNRFTKSLLICKRNMCRDWLKTMAKSVPSHGSTLNTEIHILWAQLDYWFESLPSSIGSVWKK